MVGSPILVAADNVQMVIGLPDSYVTLSDEELDDYRSLYSQLGTAMAYILSVAISVPDSLPMLAQVMKATAGILTDEVEQALETN